MLDGLSNMLGSASPFSDISPNVRVADLLDDAAGKIDTAFAKDPLIAATLHHTIGDAYLDLGLYTKARPQLASAIELRTRHLSPEHAETLAARLSSAWVLARSERRKECEAVSAGLLVQCERALGPEHGVTLDVLLLRSYNLVLFESPKNAEPTVEESLARHVRVFGDESVRTCRAK